MQKTPLFVSAERWSPALWRAVLSVALLPMALLNFSATSLHAGGLADFENAATEPKAQPPKPAPEKPNETCNNNQTTSTMEGGVYFGAELIEVVSILLVHSGMATMERVRKTEDPAFADIQPREIGAPDIPFVSADLNYQRINSRTTGIDGRAAIGYGPFGAQYRHTRYKEEGAASTLNFMQWHGLFRISMNRTAELGMGFGQLLLDGRNRNHGFSTTYPLSIFPTKHFGINFTPTWSWINGNSITDLDGSAAWVNKYCSVRIGYRRIKVNNQALSGPYAGLSFHY